MASELSMVRAMGWSQKQISLPLLAMGWLAIGWFGCGGTSAETPWPVEPLDYETQPRGEKVPQEVRLDELPKDDSDSDAGAKLD